jgi:hypothetical protein
VGNTGRPSAVGGEGEGEGAGVGGEGDSPDLATQVGRRESGVRARAARTQDDRRRRRGATLGECECEASGEDWYRA